MQKPIQKLCVAILKGVFNMFNNTNNANIVEFSVETGVLLFDTKRNTIIGFERRYDYLDSDLDCDLDYDLDSASEDVRSYKIVIPKTINGFDVKKIGNKSLCELWKIEEIILPDTIEEIEERAFCYSNIKKITIPKNVKKIGAQVFGGCRYLENIYVDEENKYFLSYDGILYNKDMTELICCAQHNKCGETVIIPDGVKKICQDAFMFTYIDELILPNSVEVLEKWAFYKNYLFKIKLSSNITKIEEACFSESQ